MFSGVSRPHFPMQVETWQEKLEKTRACRKQMEDFIVDALQRFPEDEGQRFQWLPLTTARLNTSKLSSIRSLRLSPFRCSRSLYVSHVSDAADLQYGAKGVASLSFSHTWLSLSQGDIYRPGLL